ncbi:MAG: GNAT family N-acetyltransferase [Actinomycetota bacterium]|nr:GNAT family N-acetyltransferase [Actinomycetota bacterium]
MPLIIRPGRSADAAALAAVAAATFPLACPPHTSDEAKADFIAKNLTETSFAGYLADPERALFLAELDDAPVGYTMLVFGEPHDQDVSAAISLRPTVELSKMYVLPGQHGAGVSSALMRTSLDEARARGAVGAWLGVNEENVRANRFYEKSGFERVGSKKFLVGERWEDDFVRERAL